LETAYAWLFSLCIVSVTVFYFNIVIIEPLGTLNYADFTGINKEKKL